MNRLRKALCRSSVKFADSKLFIQCNNQWRNFHIRFLSLWTQSRLFVEDEKMDTNVCMYCEIVIKYLYNYFS